ncbi:MAG: helix-turn-helix domain-containing protein [Clostridiales bacterium]|nr:helix-turn-helix domain-containing protein [Clostridiales bacterium]
MKTNKIKMQIAMARAKMTSGKLSELTGLSRTSTGRMISGAECKPHNVGIVAEALGVDVTELIDTEK